MVENVKYAVFAKRLTAKMEEKKLSITELSNKTGKTFEMVRRYTLGTAMPRQDTMLKLSEALDCSASWLQYGIKNVDDINDSIEINGKVPVISWVQAGEFSEAIDLYEAGYADEWIATTVPIRSHTFALSITGDSMEPKFYAGMRIIVEPELSPEIGDFVIAKNNNNEATFKQLVKDGSTFYLKPLNPRYDMIRMEDEGFSVIGVVRSSEMVFR